MKCHKQLLYREADIYLCMYHYKHPEICSKTHIIYHEMLYPYVLQQIQAFAKSMKRRKVNSAIREYTEINELTSEILDDVIERIEIGHVTPKSRPGIVIQILETYVGYHLHNLCLFPSVGINSDDYPFYILPVWQVLVSRAAGNPDTQC